MNTLSYAKWDTILCEYLLTLVMWSHEYYITLLGRQVVSKVTLGCVITLDVSSIHSN